MTRSGDQRVKSGDDRASLAFWHWICALASDSTSLQEWRTSSSKIRERWLEDHGFLLDELRKGLAELSRTRQIQPLQAQQARAWLEQGHLPEEQYRKILYRLAETSIKKLETLAGGVSTFYGHPVERLRTTRDKWVSELSDKEEQLYEFERTRLVDFAATTRGALEQAATTEGQKINSRLRGEVEAIRQEAQTWDDVLRQARRAKDFYRIEERRYTRYEAVAHWMPSVETQFITAKRSFDPAKTYAFMRTTTKTLSGSGGQVDLFSEGYLGYNGYNYTLAFGLNVSYDANGVDHSATLAIPEISINEFHAQSKAQLLQALNDHSTVSLYNVSPNTLPARVRTLKRLCKAKASLPSEEQRIRTAQGQPIEQQIRTTTSDVYKDYLIESRRQARELELMARTGNMVRFAKKSEAMLAGDIQKLRTSWRSLVKSLAKQALSASISATEKSLEQDRQLAHRWKLLTNITKAPEYNNKYVVLWTSPQERFSVEGHYSYDPNMDQNYRFGLFNIEITVYWTKQNGNTISLSISHYTGTNRETDGGVVRLVYYNDAKVLSGQSTGEAGSWDQAKTKYWVGLAPQTKYIAIVSAKKMVITQYKLFEASRQAYEAYMSERRKLIAELLIANSKGLNSMVMNSLNRDQPWNEAKRLYEIGRCVHTRANNGGKIAYRLQDRLEAGKISQEVKRNVGNPVLLIPAMMAANKQRLKLKSTIQTTRSAYQAAVAAVPTNSDGVQKYQTFGQEELRDAEYYWYKGLYKDHRLDTPYSTLIWYENNDIKYQYEWSVWAETSQTLFYNSEKNALATGREEYELLMATGQYTERQARNIATAYYFDALIKEDINSAEWLQKLIVSADDVKETDLIEYAPGVLRRQIRVAKWVVYTDRHPFLWQSRLRFKINREKYLNKAINKWYGGELADWENDGFFKKCWHFTDRIADVFLEGIEEIVGHVIKWAEMPFVWALNGVSKFWGGDLGTKILGGEAKAWHAGWDFFDLFLKNIALLPYRIVRNAYRLERQELRWIAHGCHPKAFWEGLKKDTLRVQHLVENITFAFLSLVTWGHAKRLMPNTAHRLHHEWRTIKFLANHLKILNKQEQELLRLETKSFIRTDAIVLKAWKVIARNTSLIESPAHYFLTHEWRWINRNKPKQAGYISRLISTTKSMTKRAAIYEKKRFAGESTTTQAQQLYWWFNIASPAAKKTNADKYLKSQFKQYINYLDTTYGLTLTNQRPINLKQWVQIMKRELYATLWSGEKADLKGMMSSAEEGSKSKYQGRGLVQMNLLLDKDLAKAFRKSSRQQRRALGYTWAMIMAWPTITTNLDADVTVDQAKYRAWRKSFMQATSYDWSGMGGNEGLSITQSLVNAFIFSITSSATEKKLRAWTKGNGKGDGLRAFRLIILAYMAPNIQMVNSDIKQRYSLAQQRYVQLNRLDRSLITREIKESSIFYGTAVRKDYQQLKKLDRKLDMLQRLGRVRITDARLKKAKQSWLDETLLVPVATLVQQSTRWSSLTAEQQETYSGKYTKWLTTNQEKKTRTLKKDIDRTKETSSDLHAQQQAWSSDQAAIASGDSMTVGQIVVTMKPAGNPDAKTPKTWESVKTPDIESIQAGLDRQLLYLSSSSGTAPPAPTPAPAPNPEIKPVQLLTLYLQIRHFDLLYRISKRLVYTDAEIKGLSDAEVRELKELGWSDEKVSRVRNILKTDGGVWQDIKSLRKQNDLEASLDQFSELERQQLQDVILSRDGRKMKAIRESVRLEDKAAEKGIDDAVSGVEGNLEQAVEDKLAGSVDNVVIDLEGNAVGEVEEAVADAAMEDEAAIEAEVGALETTIETAEIAAM